MGEGASRISTLPGPPSTLLSRLLPTLQPRLLLPPIPPPSSGNRVRGRRSLFSLFGWGKVDNAASSNTSIIRDNQAADLARNVQGKRVSEQQRLFNLDSRRWRQRVRHYMASFLGLPMKRGQIRNILDMSAGLGGFAASLWSTERDRVWVMSVVPAAAETNTLPVIADRGLIGTVHDW